MEDEKFLQAIEQIRRDKHEPWRYVLFTFVNGIAHGVGMALGLTIVTAIIVFLLVHVLTSMVDLPVIGEFFHNLLQIVNSAVQQGMPNR